MVMKVGDRVRWHVNWDGGPLEGEIINLRNDIRPCEVMWDRTVDSSGRRFGVYFADDLINLGPLKGP